MAGSSAKWLRNRREASPGLDAESPFSRKGQATGEHAQPSSDTEQRLRAVVAHAPILLWSIDREGTFTLCEGRCLAKLGFDATLLLGSSAFDLYRDLAVAQSCGTILTGEDFLLRALGGESLAGIVDMGGTEYDTRLVPLRGAGGEVMGVIGVATDVTESVRAERAHRDSEANFRALIERTPDLIVVHRSGRILYVNPAATTALGYQASEGLAARSLLDIVHPDDHAQLASHIKEVSRPGEREAPWEIRLLRRGGAPIPAEIIGVPVVFDGEAAIVSSARDITERKQMQTHLLQTDRLVGLGMLAAGVAHEINDPLTYVLHNLDLVSRSLGARANACRAAGLVKGDEMADHLEDLAIALSSAHQGSTKVRRIVRDLTTFASRGAPHRSLLDVRAVLNPVIRLVSNEIRHRATLVEDFQEVPLVNANEAQLGQVFVNLLLNATQAIPEGHADEHAITVSTHTDASGWAIVEIRDTGAGMQEEVLRRIFEPFFSTKPVGTGLGLSICHGIITALGGEVSARSEPGAGSGFRLAIPPAARRSVTPRRPASTDVTPARVLVVEPQPLVSESLKEMRCEHEVHVLTEAREALERIVGGDHFDVILCDLLMPVMTGMDLHAELLRAAPEQAIRMVFLTGAAFTDRARVFLERVPNAHFEKPLATGKLHALIEEMCQRESK